MKRSLETGERSLDKISVQPEPRSGAPGCRAAARAGIQIAEL